MSFLDKIKEYAEPMSVILDAISWIAKATGEDPAVVRKRVGEYLADKPADATDPLAAELQKLMND
jgi:hypothetical protein